MRAEGQFIGKSDMGDAPLPWQPLVPPSRGEAARAAVARSHDAVKTQSRRSHRAVTTQSPRSHHAVTT
eukprot:225906-Prorocentrum_minimum.AAC.1